MSSAIPLAGRPPARLWAAASSAAGLGVSAEREAFPRPRPEAQEEVEQQQARPEASTREVQQRPLATAHVGHGGTSAEASLAPGLPGQLWCQHAESEPAPTPLAL